MFLTAKQRSSIKTLVTTTGTRLEIKDDLNIMLTPKLTENLKFVVLKNSQKVLTEYSSNILNDVFIEDVAKIKDHFIGNVQRSKIPRRILVHLQFDAGQYFRGKGSSDLFHLYGPTGSLKKDHCYLMEIDDQRYIQNVIYDTTSAEMKNVPSWYSPDDRDPPKKKNTAYSRGMEADSIVSTTTYTSAAPFITKNDWQEFLDTWK